MELTAVKEQVEKYISKGETENALDILTKHIHPLSSRKNEVTALNGRYSRIMREQRLLLVADDSIRQEISRIDFAILQLTKLLEKGDLIQEEQRSTNNSTQEAKIDSLTEHTYPYEVILPDMAYIPGGTFQMGDVMEDGYNPFIENPVHLVNLNSFYLAIYVVTFIQYDTFCESTGRKKPHDEEWGRGMRPVININWYNAITYCNWLSEKHGYVPTYLIDGEEVIMNTQANGYRLPTEAEWEYAARGGGQKVRFGNGKDIANSREINFNSKKRDERPYSKVGEYRERTLPVGELDSSNQLGLHEMSGNVHEWCWDWYDENYYKQSIADNPKGPDSGMYRCVRGGSWSNVSAAVRVFHRGGLHPSHAYNSVGFRLARNA